MTSASVENPVRTMGLSENFVASFVGFLVGIVIDKVYDKGPGFSEA